MEGQKGRTEYVGHIYCVYKGTHILAIFFLPSCPISALKKFPANTSIQ